MLTEKQRRRYEQRLREERDRAAIMIEQSIEEQAGSNGDGDLGDRAALETEREIDQLVSTRESDRVAAIDAALQVLEETPSAYGTCRVCGRAIARERLDVLPWTLTCERHAETDGR